MIEDFLSAQERQLGLRGRWSRCWRRTFGREPCNGRGCCKRGRGGAAHLWLRATCGLDQLRLLVPGGWVRWRCQFRFRKGIDLRRADRQLDGSLDICEHLVASVEPHGEPDTFDPSPTHRTVQNARWQRIPVVDSRSRGPAWPVQQNGHCPVVILRPSNGAQL